ncbi:hypothetical protein FB567DRAFT_444807 [Paraphoma chrysanthemicola]|uniref:Multiple RNA-binding domain-containing protein 1 n=1 Tax=Paraphoma chrysanthemicola TaxID=798071 RepID=A0A8K0R6M0_9PLEO|nr:hypothetical protein FB567DRAFT_444807 [Paraphoma chrysanthemicola]
MESSRIFVRGLPPRFTDDDVRKHFAKFPVTDVKFFPHRRIGYVGYKTPEDAAKAVKYFNKTFINLTKIHVESARPIADKELPKSRRQQRLERSAPAGDEYVAPLQESALKRKRDQAEQEQDPKLNEFLQVYQAPSKTNIWTNGDSHLDGGPVATVDTGPGEVVVPVPVSDDESESEYQTIAKKPRLASAAPTAMPLSEPIAAPSNTDMEVEKALPLGIDVVDRKVDVSTEGQVGVSDIEWLHSRTNRVLDLVEDDEQPVVKGPESTITPPTAQPVSPAAAEQAVQSSQSAMQQPEIDASTEMDKIRETGRLYLRNLHFGVTEDEIRQHFSNFGRLEEVHVPLKKSDGKGKGYAFVQFKEPEQAVEAYDNTDGTIFQGRLLHIISAKVRKDVTLNEYEISKLPLKKQKEIRRKQDATRSTFNWNSLYLNAIMSTIANRMGITKAELLDPTSSDAAVKQAHAETHIIQETKSYFAQHGVDLEAFQKSSKGDLAILVKNVPHGVTSDELRRLFEEHGTVTKFLMPPTGMTAIVEFSNIAQAKTAFMSLSYRKLKDSILYLEKAPKSLFKEGAKIDLPEELPSGAPATRISATDLLVDVPEPEASSTATLYVRNLNFSTTTERLTDAFKPLAGFRSAKVKTKVDPKRGILSMGFGFVEFNDAESASAALRTMDGSNLDEHRLLIKASHKGENAAEERHKQDAVKKAASPKIIIKNLPFEAGKKDVRALFTPYGQLRSVRVPKKFDSSSRGFGFAEFTTKRDAVNAMNALRNTHLLGRRLVLAFAETESDDPEAELEKMQQKVGAQANKVALQRLTEGGRRKFNVAGTEDLDD